MSNVNLAASENSIIEISGLLNATSNRNVTLLENPSGNDGFLLFGTAGVASTAIFEHDALTLTIMPGQTLIAQKVYALDFEVTNPGAKQPAPELHIKASGTAVFESERLAVPHLPVTGVINGSDVMLIEMPSFEIKAIAQSIPLA